MMSGVMGSGFLYSSVKQEIAFVIDRAEAGLLDLQQRIGKSGDGTRIAKVRLQHRHRLRCAASPARPFQNSARTVAQEKKLGCTP